MGSQGFVRASHRGGDGSRCRRLPQSSTRKESPTMGTVSGKRCVKQIVYDLEKHWLFWMDTGGAVTLEELEARYEPDIRGQAIFGDPLRTKPVRVLVNISAEGLSLWETGKRISHRWADRAPPDLNELAAL